MRLRLPAGLFLLLLLGSCGAHDHKEEETPGGGSVTIWTKKTELFMEYPALVVGKEVRFAAHLTRLSDFKPFTNEVVHFRFLSEKGVVVEQTVEEPSPQGIYRPTVTFQEPGNYELTLIARDGSVDTITVESIQVFRLIENIPPTEESGSPEQLISFLKEQQWKTDFFTEPVRREKISGSIHAAGEIIPKLNAEAIVAAPFTGYVPAGGDSPIPAPGTNVPRWGVLAVMLPSAETPGGSEDFASRYTDAETDRGLAAREYDRAKRLFAIQGISEKEFQEAEAEFRRAETTYNSLRSYLGTDAGTSSSDIRGGFALKAPIAGRIAEVFVVPGKQVNAGEPLFRLINVASVWVRVNVSVTDIASVDHPNKAWIHLSGTSEPFEINKNNGRLISVGSAIDEETRTIPVIFEVQNRNERLRIGMVGEVYIATGKEHDGLVIPETALIEEEGRYSVYVHVDGESFARREVRLGDRETGRVEILIGVRKDERIVTEGAYQVRLASLSSQLPAHGHEH